MDQSNALKAIQDTWEGLIKKLDEILSKKSAVSGILQKLESITSVRKSYIVLALLSTLLFGILMDGGTLLCNLIIFVIPVYCSINAIESSDKEDDSLWLTYWICYCAFGLFETLFWPILTAILSDYYLAKTVFFVWCMSPSSKYNGATIVYVNIIRPLFFKLHKKIESQLPNVEQVINDAQKALGDAQTMIGNVQSVAETLSKTMK